MKKTILAALATLGLMLSLTGTASAVNNENQATIGSDGCSVSVHIFNENRGTGAYGQGDGIALNSGTCAYVGIKTRIQKCDGTTSTSAEVGVFNPTYLGGPSQQFNFSCQSGGVIGVYIRADSVGGVWNPTQSPTPNYIYYFVGPPEGCFPAYCFL